MVIYESHLNVLYFEYLNPNPLAVHSLKCVFFILKLYEGESLKEYEGYYTNTLLLKLPFVYNTFLK